MRPLAEFLDAIADPLAATLRAAADWLEGDPELPESEGDLELAWRIDERGQAVQVKEG
jgi:hypothetical protein